MPQGVLRATRRPPLTASMGRTERYRLSGTLAASSTTRRSTAEKPRTLCSVLGREMTREPFASSNRNADSFSGRTGSAARHFWNNSEDWRWLGLRSSTRLLGEYAALCAASTAETVDLPLWREQLSRMRSASERNTSACQGSGTIPASRASTAGSNALRRSGTLTTFDLPQSIRHGEPRLRVGRERVEYDLLHPSVNRYV